MRADDVFGLQLGRGVKVVRKQMTTSHFAKDLVVDVAQPDCRAISSSLQSLRLEQVEQRYVLLGGGDGQIALYDHETLALPEGNGPLVTAMRGKGRHRQGVCMAQWYANDNGIFSVGSFDGSVGIWDTNEFAVAHLYNVSDCVNTIANGIFHETSSLIAVATKSDRLRLLDIRQDANTHTLVGHRDQVISLAWSNVSPYGLFSGDVEGSVYVWDLRKPVPLAELGSSVAPKIIGAMGRSESDGLSGGSSSRGIRGGFNKTLGFGRQNFKLDRQVDAVVKSSHGLVQRPPNGSSAHQGAINSILLSPKGQNIFTFSLAPSRGGSDRQLKVWDSSSFELINSISLGRVLQIHPFLRFDMCMNNEPYDTVQRLLVGLNSRMFCMEVDPWTGMTSWPSGHDRGMVSIQYNGRLQRYYSCGTDGMWRVWMHGDAATDSNMEIDREGPDGAEEGVADWEEIIDDDNL